MISIQNHHSVTCVHVEGRLDTLTAGEFDSIMTPLLSGDQHVVVDMSKCTYLSSFGIRSLLKALKPQKRASV